MEAFTITTPWQQLVQTGRVAPGFEPSMYEVPMFPSSKGHLTGRMLAGVLLVSALPACNSTLYRMVRYREPDARNQHMFPARTVAQSAAPYVFQRATVLRDDMDSIMVRDRDGRRIRWDEYMKKHAVLAFLVIRNDTIVYERYREGFTGETIHNSFSVAKSVLSSLVGAALADGSIRSLDQQVTEFIPELKRNSALNGVTLRNLLEMKSGLRFTPADGNFLAAMRSDEANIYYSSNTLNRIAKTPRATEPGSIWKYKDSDAELLGLVVARATGKSIAAYTEEKIWRRIGTEHAATWSLDHTNGQEKVSSGFNATARDYARFGRLYLHNGSWNGTQILPADWVNRSAHVDGTRPEPEISNWWQMQHSYYWWHPLQPKQGDFYADGSHGQRIYVDPASNTIIVQLANDSDQDFPFRRITSFLAGLPWAYPKLLPGTLVLTARNFGVDSIRPVYERLMAERAQYPERVVYTASGMRAAGRLLMDSSRTQAAGVAVLQIAVEHSPTIAPGFMDLSDAYLKVGDRTKAIEAIRRARELAPADANILKRAAALGVAP